MVLEQHAKDPLGFAVFFRLLVRFGTDDDDEFALLAVWSAFDPRFSLAQGKARNLFELLGELACNDHFATRSQDCSEIFEARKDTMRRFVQDNRVVCPECCNRFAARSWSGG